MRILLTVHQFFPTFRAGTEVLTLSVAKELIRRGHEVRIYTAHPTDLLLSENERFDEYEYEGIHIYRFHHSYTIMSNQKSMIEIGFNNNLSVEFLKLILNDFSPQLVHHFHLNRLGIGVINLLNKHEIPQHFTVTDFWMICPTAQLMLGDGQTCSGPSKNAGNCIQHLASNSVGGFIGSLVQSIPVQIIDKFASIVVKNKITFGYPFSNEVLPLSLRIQNTVDALNKLQSITVANSFMKDLFIRYNVKKELIFESPFGINVNSTEETIKETDCSQPLRIGFIGTLAPHKGCHILVDAFMKLPCKSATLEIYGEGDESSFYYNKLISDINDNPFMRFCGIFPNEIINEIFKRFDVLVVPSLWYENTPLVIHSAQASKCPVIASDYPGISEVIHNNINGLLFTPGDSDALAYCLNMVNKNRELISAFSKNSKEPVTIEKYVETLINQWGIT